jgi:hypothetical protein
LEPRGERLADLIRASHRRLKGDLEGRSIALFSRGLLAALVVVDVAVISLTAEAPHPAAAE